MFALIQDWTSSGKINFSVQRSSFKFEGRQEFYATIFIIFFEHYGSILVVNVILKSVFNVMTSPVKNWVRGFFSS